MLLPASKFKYVVLLSILIICVGNVKTETNEISNIEADKKMQVVVLEQKSVKKELKVNVKNDSVIEITPSPNKKDIQPLEKLVITNQKSVTESSSPPKVVEQQQTNEMGKQKNRTLETVKTPTGSLKPQLHKHHVYEEFLLKDEDDVSESVKTGFYFFLILSSGAILFIVFKIYRLRLSRAERKYGVQGDRSLQELTPLPISIEDGNSDEEDQTLFDIQRQNIRIL